jgi:hypothetical protein
MLTIQRFDPSTCGFPTPRVAVLPQPEAAALRLRRNAHDAGLRWYARARYALTDAYRLCGLDKHGVLIAPSYHCRTMIDPALAIGSQVHLYHLTTDLTPIVAISLEPCSFHTSLAWCNRSIGLRQRAASTVWR